MIVGHPAGLLARARVVIAGRPRWLPPPCVGIVCLVGRLGAAPPDSVSWLGSEQVPVSGIITGVAGSLGTVVFAGLCNIVEVGSPTVARRQADTFGTSTPNRSLTSFSCDVWSNTSEAM